MRFLILLFTLAFILNVHAQNSEDGSLEQTLQQLSSSAASAYLTPIGSAFGANLNAGWFHKAPDPQMFGFDIEIGVVAMAAQFPSGAEHFQESGSFRFSQSQAQSILSSSSDWNSLPADVQSDFLTLMASQDFSVEMEGATIIGASDDYITIRFPGQTITESNSGQSVTVDDQEVVLPIGGFKDLAQSDMLPMAAPQLTLGTIMGTSATLRYLPAAELNPDLGALQYIGYGVQHNPDAWLPVPLPFDLAAGFFTQTMTIGDLFTATTTSYGLNASIKLGWEALNITPYAGYMIEKSTMAVSYDYIVDSPAGPISQKINFDLEGENTSRITLGVSIRFLVVNINADYNIGAYNNFSAGVFFAL